MQVNPIHNVRSCLDLNLPTDWGSSTASLYGILQQRLEGISATWKAKLLSGGNEVMIKPVSQALPGYLTATFCKQSSLKGELGLGRVSGRESKFLLLRDAIVV